MQIVRALPQSLVQFAPLFQATPTVLAGGRQPRDSQRRTERQNISCTLDRPQQGFLGVAIWKSFVVELDLRHPKHGDQQSNNCTEQSRAMLIVVDLSNQVGAIMAG